MSLPQTVPQCSYEEVRDFDNERDHPLYVWVCRIHGEKSKYSNDELDRNPHLPCLAVDSGPFNVFDHAVVEHSVETYGRNPIEGIVNYPKHSGDIEIRLIEED